MREILNAAVEGIHSAYRAVAGNGKREMQRLDDIRLAMLDTLGQTGARRFPQVVRRIKQSADVEALWYVRPDLMASLAVLHDEQTANSKMYSLSMMFDGLLPKGMMSRPGTLRSGPGVV
jgi:hypothetical protein